ncbi:MAG: hypothetical protein LUF87_00185 [Alistipes sp.]|nr:hypothetical protein [Alistipes sp.]
MIKQTPTDILLERAAAIRSKKPDINPGLKDGLTGSALVLYCLSRQTNSSQLEEQAGELLEDIIGFQFKKFSLPFSTGIPGIGWGLQYLWEQRFIDGDIDFILEDFDNTVREVLTYNTYGINILSSWVRTLFDVIGPNPTPRTVS